jgi:hypothetical protein
MMARRQAFTTIIHVAIGLAVAPGTLAAGCAAQPRASSAEAARVVERQTTTTPQTTKTDSAAPTTPPKTSSAPETAATLPLDLAGLEKRLRDTKASGVFTKLALKNQVDDLLEQFKSFHEGRGGATLAELRERYNLLMLKVLSLLQRDDPRLARDLSASRDALWTILTDPVKFANARGG